MTSRRPLTCISVWIAFIINQEEKTQGINTESAVWGVLLFRDKPKHIVDVWCFFLLQSYILYSHTTLPPISSWEE